MISRHEAYIRWCFRVIVAAVRWGKARQDLVDASIYPIGNDDYRKRLNELAAAEDTLARALRMEKGK